jgi:hypothetical protein
MTRMKIGGGFTACDTAVLNGFFRDYIGRSSPR